LTNISANESGGRERAVAYVIVASGGAQVGAPTKALKPVRLLK
jgi:hypothetical protein